MVKKFQVTLALMLSVALLTLVGCGTKSSLRGSIVGYVLDSQTGIGISGATVTTSPSTSSVITDINGAFSINDINAGVYTVTANASDYNGNSVTCSVDSGTSATTNLVLVSTGGSFSRNILPIFSVNCAISGCHDDSSAAGGLRLNSYDTVMRGGRNGSVIHPYDASTSTLVKRLKGTETPRMPMDRATLSTNDQGLIQNWVNGGARNN